MPLNPVENIPEALRRPNFVCNKFCSGFSDLRSDEQKEFKARDSMTFTSTESMEAADGASHVASYSYPMNTLMNQAKVIFTIAVTWPYFWMTCISEICLNRKYF